MSRDTIRRFFSSTTDQGPILPIYDPRTRAQSGIVTTGVLDDNTHVFRQIAGLPRKRWAERWADNIRSPVLRYPAKGGIKFSNWVADYPLHFLFGLWGLCVAFNLFMKWAVYENIKDGGEGFGTAVTLQSLIFSQETLAFAGLGLLVTAGLLSFLRGPKKPDYTPFKQFISHVEEIPVESDYDQERKRVITRPNPESPEECDATVGWITKFISWLADGADASSDEEQDLEGVWEAIGYILRDIREHFPFQFQDRYQEIPGHSPSESSRTSSFDDERKEEDTIIQMEPDPNAKERKVRDNVMEQVGKQRESQLLTSNWGLLARALAEPQQQSQSRPSYRPPSPSPTKPVSQPSRKLVERDLYNTPLLDHDELTQHSELLSAPAVPPVQMDSFLTASPEEKRAAAKLDWREIQTIERKNPQISYRDIAMRVTSHVVKLRIHRKGLLKKEGERKKAVKILHGLLKGILSDPFVADRFAQDRSFVTETAYKSFQIVNLLRPAMSDGQWHNWRYFYAQDPIVTESFKLLSSQEQAWMIFTLMSGNDHGKLLALSILQDERLALTHFGSANDRDTTTAAKDIWAGSCLAKFFETYLAEFGAMSEERAREAFYDLERHYPNPQELQNFRIGVTNQMRLQLLWLTENSTGRLKALFEAHAGVAAKILLGLTANLPDVGLVQRTYAVPAEKPARGGEKQVSYKERKQLRARHVEEVMRSYCVEPSRDSGRFNFSLLGEEVTREDVVNKLLPLVGNDNFKIVYIHPKEGGKELPLRFYLSDEIAELLRRPDLRHTVPKALQEGVDLLEKMDQLTVKKGELEQKLRKVFNEFLAFIPPENAQGLKTFPALLQYFQEKSNALQNVPLEVGEDRLRDYAIRVLQEPIEKGPLFNEAKEQLSATERAFQMYCSQPDVVEKYLKSGIGVNQPLGARTAAMYAAATGKQVEVYEENSEVFSAGEVELRAIYECEDSPTVRIMLGANYTDWAVLKEPAQHRAPKQKQKSEVARLSFGGFSSSEEDDDIGIATFSDSAPRRESELPPHPMATRAQELFWSISNSAQQQEILKRMDNDKPSAPSKGIKGASRYLFLLGTPENITAIKRGVLQSESLYALYDRLKGHDTREDAYGVLAALLSDPVHGIDYQRAFRKLVNAHYSELASDEQIQAFLHWLDNSAPANVDPVTVRARFAAVMLMEAGLRDSQHASTKADRVIAIATLIYPNDSLMTVFDRIHPAFESDPEWEIRRRVFRVVFTRKLLLNTGALEDGLQLLSQNGLKDLIDEIVDGFKGNVMADPEANKRVKSWGDMLSLIITESAPGHADFMRALVTRLCDVLADQSVDLDTRLNLGLVLLNALDALQDMEVSVDSTLLAPEMHKVMSAFVAGFGQRLNDFKPDFYRMDQRLISLGAKRRRLYRRDGRVSEEDVPAYLERFYFRVAMHVLKQAKEERSVGKLIEGHELLSHVVFHPETYRNINYLDRKALGSHLDMIISSEIYNGRSDVQEDQQAIAAHRGMVHRALFLFFYDLSGLNDLTQYGSRLSEICFKVNGSHPATALNALILGIRGDQMLRENFGSEMNTVLFRMVVLALHHTYQSMPASSYRFCGDRSRERDERHEVAIRLLTLLKVTGLVRNEKDINEIHNALAHNTPIGAVFNEMGMSKLRDNIYDVIKDYNNFEARNASSRFTDKSPLLHDTRGSNSSRPIRMKDMSGTGPVYGTTGNGNQTVQSDEGLATLDFV